MIKFFGYVRHFLLSPIRSSFSVSEDSERKDSFQLFLLRLLCSWKDSSTLFLESTFLFFFLLPLFLFLTLIDYLERVFIPAISNCQSNFVTLILWLLCSIIIQMWTISVTMESGRHMFIIYKTFMSQDAVYFWSFLVKLVSSWDNTSYKNAVCIRFTGHWYSHGFP